MEIQWLDLYQTTLLYHVFRVLLVLLNLVLSYLVPSKFKTNILVDPKEDNFARD